MDRSYAALLDDLKDRILLSPLLLTADERRRRAHFRRPQPDLRSVPFRSPAEALVG